MNIFLVVLAFVIFTSQYYAYWTMKITTTQDYYIPMRTIGINCTSTLQVDDNIIEINIGSSEIQIASIAYIESTGQCLTAPPGGSIINAIDCQSECSCSLNGRSIFFTYNVTSENQTLKLKCSALQNKNPLSDSTVIKKANGPSNISINATSPVTAREGDPVGPISCTADDCVPDCTYSWTGPGFLGNGSVLHIRNIKRENKGIYECTAFNIFDTTTDNIEVIVNYGPINVTINPINQTYIIEEDTQLGPIYCTSQCIPECNFTWRGPKIISTTSVLLINHTNRANAGEFVCTAANEIGTSNIMFIVEVHHGPSNVSFDTMSPISVSEGDTLGPISCSANCIPGCSYRWAGPGLKRDYSVLRIDDVKKEDRGLYNCTAFNSYKESSSSIEVFVNYGPGAVILEPSNQTYIVKENTNVSNISCTAQCHPACTLNWTGPGITSTSNVLHVHSIERNNTGQFVCTASNDIGTLNTTVQVTVQYAAEIKFMNVFNTTENYVPENTSLHFICEAIGVPNPTIRWYHTDTVGQTKLVSNEHMFSIQSASCTDTGNYTCKAHNEGFNPHYMSEEINISCVPRLLKNCSSLFDEILTVKRNETLTVQACFLSNPQPVPNWIQHNENKSVNIVDPAKSHVYKNTTILYTATLDVVLNLEKEVNVTVNVNNSFAVSSTTLFVIRIKDKPSAPQDVEVLCKEENAVYWSSSFNGGSVQMFKIQYTEYNQTKHQTTENISDKGQSKRHYTFLKLKPETFYSFIVIATNDINSTQSEALFCTTRGIENGVKNVAAIGGGTATGIFLIGVIVLGILLYQRRHTRTKSKRKDKSLLQKKQSSQDENEDAYDLKDNPIYDSHGEKNVEYSAVSKKKRCNQEFANKAEIRNGRNSDVYENHIPIDLGSRTTTAIVQKNKDGLIYADLDLSSSGSKFVIRGLESRSIYAIIDHTKTAEPLPSSDEDDTKNAGK